MGSDDQESELSRIMNSIADPRLLRTLLAVIRHGSMSTAAAALGYVPSAVSQHIARLEQQEGTELLSRRPGGGVTPTAAGRALDDAAAHVLAATADFQRLAHDIARSGAPEVSIGVYADRGRTPASHRIGQAAPGPSGGRAAHHGDRARSRSERTADRRDRSAAGLPLSPRRPSQRRRSAHPQTRQGAAVPDGRTRHRPHDAQRLPRSRLGRWAPGAPDRRLL